MRKKHTRLRNDKDLYLNSQGSEFSPVEREQVDEAMAEKRLFPKGNDRRYRLNLVSKCLAVKPVQHRFTKKPGMDFSWLVEEVIDELIVRQWS